MVNKTTIMNSFNRTLNRTVLKVKKYSPEILVGAGIIGGVVSGVMACKATTKIDTILDDTKEKIDIIHAGMENGSVNGTEYTLEDGKKDLAIVYAQSGLKLTKLYAPSIILGGLSITSILAGHNILRKRNVALAAAYTLVDKSFKEYRGRVIERFGEELDRELKYNIKREEVETTVVDENGKEKKVKKTIETIDGLSEYSEYAKFFDESCYAYEKDPELNLTFLRLQERNANDRLQARGYLFLNEVYDMLGIPRTKAGQMVGWVYDEKDPNGDNYVSFGLYETNKPKVREFVNGYETVILLDFNVDGVILDLI